MRKTRLGGAEQGYNIVQRMQLGTQAVVSHTHQLADNAAPLKLPALERKGTIMLVWSK